MSTEVLRQAPLLASLSDEEATALQRSMVPHAMSRGEVLFREGEPGDRLYIIIRGKIKLGRTSPDGRENLVSVLGPGEMFGELTVFDPGARSLTATAVSPTELLGLGSEDLSAFLREHPEVARQMLQALARRLRRTTNTVADLVFSDVPGRVAKAMLDLARRFGRETDGGLLVSHELTQEELAQLVGASRETVNKALADFVARGWIKLEARAVLILDPERLSKRAR